MRLIFIPIIIAIIGAVIGGYLYFGQAPKNETVKDLEEIETLEEEPETTVQPEENLPQIQKSDSESQEDFWGGEKPSETTLKPVEPSKPAAEPQEPTPEPSEPTPESSEPEPIIPINTNIVSGPKEGEVFDNTNEITFEFEVELLEEIEGRVYFETKFEGFDEDWKSSSLNKRKVQLPGPKEYTFLVRAKIKDLIDPTPAKRTFKINVSPYFEKVKITGTTLETSSSPSLITLSTYLKKGEEINITSWSIRGKKGSFTIPQGIEKYRHLYENDFQDIFVKYGDKVYLSGASGPLGRNIHFRPNKCMGYLKNYRDFPISISKNCPKPTTEEISHLEPCCQQFILGLSRCEAPDYSQNQRVLFDPECTSYINTNLNHEGCFRNYSQDEDFVGKNWHIYMGTDFIIKGCDTLYLRDQRGLLVDEYDYGRLYCK